MAHRNKIPHVPATRPGSCIPAIVLLQIAEEGGRALYGRRAARLARGDVVIGGIVLGVLVVLVKILDLVK